MWDFKKFLLFTCLAPKFGMNAIQRWKVVLELLNFIHLPGHASQQTSHTLNTSSFKLISFGPILIIISILLISHTKRPNSQNGIDIVSDPGMSIIMIWYQTSIRILYKRFQVKTVRNLRFYVKVILKNWEATVGRVVWLTFWLEMNFHLPDTEGWCWKWFWYTNQALSKNVSHLSSLIFKDFSSSYKISLVIWGQMSEQV